MRLVSIDIETTGIDPHMDQILQVGAVIFDTDADEFTSIGTYNKHINHSKIFGNIFAINMNQNIIANILSLQEKSKFVNSFIIEANLDNNELLSLYSKYSIELHNSLVDVDSFGSDFNKFLDSYNARYMGSDNKYHLNITGKNYQNFDKLFLNEMPNFKKLVKSAQRTLDPCNMYLLPTDVVPPSLSECKERAINIISTNTMLERYNKLFDTANVTHDALDDALDVAKLVFLYFKIIECKQ